MKAKKRASSCVIELQDAVTKPQLHPGIGRAGRVPPRSA